MVAFILLLLFIGIVVMISKSCGSSKRTSTYYGGYARNFNYDKDDFDEDYNEYSDSETRAARGERDYFTDDPADDYNSYYAQVADDAMMGDREAMDEMCGEFGDW